MKTNLKWAILMVAFSGLCLSVMAGQAPDCLASSPIRFFAAPPSPTGVFGTAVALSGDLAAVSALRDDGACPETTNGGLGAVYFFRWNGLEWQREARLHGSDQTAGDLFGWAVALDGSRVAGGAPQCTATTPDPCTEPGAVYVFEYGAGTQAWMETAKLTPAGGALRDPFGEAVALSATSAQSRSFS